MSVVLAPRRTAIGRVPRAAVLSLLVLGAAGARAALNGPGIAAGFIAGTAFGLGLVALAVAAGWRPGRPTLRGAVIGLGGALVLVTIPLAMRFGAAGPIGMRPEPMLAWGLVTVLVAFGEEAVLRGGLFDRLQQAGGPFVAVAVGSLLFAAIHVPLYGWSVVPVDLAAGVWLGGLRMLSGGVMAPAVAHVLADLSTWWL